ncbi:unnamed protein product [Brassica rapa]|uniref:non-specific serine/threonine protein kinase n=2 Tax=Brassica campestris TaxID=3711 RepID=A0A8D9GF82_BRACM|nr:unnamed protein product [Brassica rapa]
MKEGGFLSLSYSFCLGNIIGTLREGGRGGGEAGAHGGAGGQRGGAGGAWGTARRRGRGEGHNAMLSLSVLSLPSKRQRTAYPLPSTSPTTHNNGSVCVDKLPEGINEMKIKDDKEMEAAVVDGNGTETGHIIVTTIGCKDGQPKQTISYMAERVVEQGSFGIVFQAKCLETGETVAIKKVLQDKRYKNRELQTMRLLDHPNVVSLKHCFFSTTEKDELYLNLVLEYVPETVYRVSKHYSRANQRMPTIYVKLYTYQICRALAYIHGGVGVCHRDIKPQNLLVNPHTHQVKLCDFGSAKVLVKGEPNISSICSRYYRAPELIFGATEYTTAIDIWSAGCVLAELLLGQPLFPGESGVDQLVEIIKVLGTPTREEIKCMNPNYTEFKFPQIKARPWHKIFHKRTPPEAVDLASRLLQYSTTTKLGFTFTCCLWLALSEAQKNKHRCISKRVLSEKNLQMNNQGSQNVATCKPVTTFVHTDTDTFREVVQHLTGPSESNAAAVPEATVIKSAIQRKPTSKLHERRQCMRPKLEIDKPPLSFKPTEGDKADPDSCTTNNEEEERDAFTCIHR